MLPEVPEGEAIPRIIHQTYPTKALPSKLQVNVDALQAANPGWEYRLYDDEEIELFILEHYGGDILASYRRISPSRGAARADLFRYLLIYRVGGVYLDIKSTASRPLDEIIKTEDRYILSQWDQTPGGEHAGWGLHPELSGGEFQQWFLIAAPGHAFLRAVIEQVLRNIERYKPERDGVDKFAVFRLTGPIAYTRAILPLLDRHPHRLVVPNTRLGLIYTIFEGSHHAGLFKGHHTRNLGSITRISRPRALALAVRVHAQIAAGRAFRIVNKVLRALRH